MWAAAARRHRVAHSCTVPCRMSPVPHPGAAQLRPGSSVRRRALPRHGRPTAFLLHPQPPPDRWAALTAPHPPSVPQSCQEALTTAPAGHVYLHEKNHRHRARRLSRPARPALPGRGRAGAVPSRRPVTSLALGEGRVTLKTPCFQRLGAATCPWLHRQSRARWGDLPVASCPGGHRGQEPVPAGEAQPRQASIPLLVVLALQGREGRERVRCHGLGWGGYSPSQCPRGHLKSVPARAQPCHATSPPFCCISS